MEKSHVGVSNCFFCGETKEILLQKQFRKILPSSAVYNKEPCDKCKKYMKQGIILISIRNGETDMTNPYRTGMITVVTTETIEKIITSENLKQTILKERVAFVPDDAWDAIGLPREEQENHEI